MCILLHIFFGFFGWFFLISYWSNIPIAIFGALTITFGSYSLKQQPCIIYTLAWFPLTLYQNPSVSAIAVFMMITAGYYPFGIYLLPLAAVVHLFWFQECWLLFGIIPGLVQLIPFLKHLPNTIKRLNDKCEETPEVEKRFYIGVIPILLIPWSNSGIWPLTVLSAAFSLGLLKGLFPRVHERWLIVLQFCIGWMSVSALNNLGLSTLNQLLVVFLHAFDLFWHNISCLPPRPWVELWKRPSRAFKTKLTAYLEANLGDFKVSGLPYPLFTGHINGFKTIGYCGSMQTKKMWAWRKSFNHDPFIDGVDENELTARGVRFCYSRKKLDWPRTEVPNLYRNPSL